MIKRFGNHGNMKHKISNIIVCRKSIQMVLWNLKTYFPNQRCVVGHLAHDPGTQLVKILISGITWLNKMRYYAKFNKYPLYIFYRIVLFLLHFTITKTVNQTQTPELWACFA